ncbi:MAG: HEAT repeat domain-containing protein [Candidatus Dormibacteria bacterium]
MSSTGIDRVLAGVRKNFNRDSAWEQLKGLEPIPASVVLERGRSLVSGADPLDRVLGIWALRTLISRRGRRGSRGNPYLRERQVIFRRLIAREQDPEVLAEAIHAASESTDTKALPLLIGHIHHPAAEVRRSVAAALPLCWPTNRQGEAIPNENGFGAIEQLTNDPDDDVRDWALFALGTQLSLDGAAVTAMLRAHVTDVNPVARAEALMGLALRRDHTVVRHLIRELRGEEVGTLEIKAAAELADPRLQPALRYLRRTWPEERELIEAAIAACGGQIPRVDSH